MGRRAERNNSFAVVCTSQHTGKDSHMSRPNRRRGVVRNARAARRLVLACTPELLERRMMLAGSMPAGYTLLEQFNIGASSVQTSHTLGSGTTYYLRATGAVTLSNSKVEDAEFYDTAAVTPADTVTITSGTDDGGIKVSGSAASSRDPDWG